MTPRVDYAFHLTKILIFQCERIIKKISFERHVYETVDNMVISHKSTETRTQDPKGYVDSNTYKLRP